MAAPSAAWETSPLMADQNRHGHVYKAPDPGHVDPLGRLGALIGRGVAPSGPGYDPRVVAAFMPLAGYWRRYFDGKVSGLGNVPDGPVLLVANHSGGILVPDIPIFLHAWYRRFGTGRRIASLTFDLLFGLPAVAHLLRRLGSVPADWANALEALEAGDAVFVCPGGDHEVYRTYAHRDEIDFGGRDGFVRLALRTGVPLVPVVMHGGHNTVWIVSRGERLASAMHLDRVRTTIFPFSWFPPFGVWPAMVPYIPLPARITIEVLTPMDWSRFGPESADDPETVRACTAEVTSRMQAKLSQLAESHPTPVVERVLTAPGQLVRRSLGVGLRVGRALKLGSVSG